jgi:hypothetical protein
MGEYIFLIEGGEDERFVREIISTEISNEVDLYKYEQKTPTEVNKFIQVYTDTHHHHYYLTDLDAGQDDCYCCGDREEFERSRFQLESFEVLVVADEIESWYLAGVPNSIVQKRDVDLPDDFEEADKDVFDNIFTDSDFTSKERFKIEILQRYDYDLARERNDSFAYVASAVGL